MSAESQFHITTILKYRSVHQDHDGFSSAPDGYTAHVQDTPVQEGHEAFVRAQEEGQDEQVSG